MDFLAKNAIDELPPRLREVFILYFYKEQSYREIAQYLGISYANVCKRISKARAILKEELSGYVKDEVFSDSPPPKGGKYQETIPQQPMEIDVLVSVGELEEVSLVASEIPEDTELFVPQIETVIVPTQSEEEIGENRGDDSGGNESDLLLSDDEVTGEYISGAMSRMGCVGGVCQCERKKAIIALENAVNLESDNVADWLVLGKYGAEGGKLLGYDRIFREDWGEAVEVLGEFSTEYSYDSSGFFCFPPW